MSEILEKEILLTELGENITTTLLLTHGCPYVITLVLMMKEENKTIRVIDFFKRYMSDTKGNAGFLKHVIKDAINCDLIEFK